MSFDAFFARAIALRELDEARFDCLTDKLARGECTEADLMEHFRSMIGGQIGQCRICLEEEEYPLLIEPCDCKGSARLIHRTCLEMWQARGCHARLGLCLLR